MSILIGYVCGFVLILFLERFSMKTLSVLVWTEGLTKRHYCWFQCCVYTLIFRHDSTAMIRPRGTKQYSILPKISWRNQSSQSKSYFNNSLNVSLVIQKKRTVIHNLFSFSDNSLSYKSRNLIVIHVIGRVDVSINKFFGSFLNFFWASTSWSLKKYHILPFFNENKCSLGS